MPHKRDTFTTELQFLATDPEPIRVTAPADYSGQEVTIELHVLQLESSLSTTLKLIGAKVRRDGTAGTSITTFTAMGPEKVSEVLAKMPEWVLAELRDGNHWAVPYAKGV